MTLLIAAAFLAQQGASYFPMSPGNEWEYKVRFGNGLFEISQIHRCGAPLIVSGVTVLPMEVILDGKSQSTTYYKEDAGYFWIAGSKEIGLFLAPQKMLPVNPKVGDKWEFRGDSNVMGRMVPTVIKSKISKKEKVNVSGKEEDALRVTTETVFGSDKSTAKINSSDLYVAGIGMVYSRQELDESKQKSVALFTLVKYKVSANLKL